VEIADDAMDLRIFGAPLQVGPRVSQRPLMDDVTCVIGRVVA